MKPLANLFKRLPHSTLASVPDGLEGRILGELARQQGAGTGASLVFVARDGSRLPAIEQALGFFAPDVEVLILPGWDCLPYDRVSPNSIVVARRMTTLAALAKRTARTKPLVLLTTVNAAVQRLPTPDLIARQSFSARPGNRFDMSNVVKWLEDNGFSRTATVRDTGEYAVRGGIVDLYPPGFDAPVRLDFFGDTLESIRAFDPESQRTTGTLHGLELVPMSEVTLVPDTIARFRTGYVARFGTSNRDDLLYQAVSEGRRHAGIEHWLPLFHGGLATIFDYCPAAPFVIDTRTDEAVIERLDQVGEHYQSRVESLERGDAGVPYKPIEPKELYLTREEWTVRLADSSSTRLTPFAVPDRPDVIDLGGRQGRSFAAERAAGDVNVFDAVIDHLGTLRNQQKRHVIVAAWTEGARDRLAQVLADHGLERTQAIGRYDEILAYPRGTVGLAILGLEAGFELPDVVIVAEQDILGDRLVRPKRKKAKGSEFLTEVTGLNEGDLVVHADHGIGRFLGLKTITAAGAPHDCLEIQYHGGDKLYLPVENIELLSRYGADDDGAAQLDRLGGGAWQARKARMKSRIREIAAKLIQTAALRALKTAAPLTPTEGLYDEFCAKFPYDETEDQLNAIEAVFDDLGSGKPMDRLICGDVGFGKTEVALRAAFKAVQGGRQVAVLVPTTVLAQQHLNTFRERMAGYPIAIEMLSRFRSRAELKKILAATAAGQVDILIGTHRLLQRDVVFRELGLVVIDEEQRFGVKHKEIFKRMRATVDLLSMSATPIPRTLYMALTGARDLSVIETPPTNRHPIQTIVKTYDEKLVVDAVRFELRRGGQVFYLHNRVQTIDLVAARLRELMPDVRVGVGHGQMHADELEEIMTDFVAGRYQVLVSTTIIESGLDIPNSNTIIIEGADRFGLSQLYQLRGRVGRFKHQAYAYLLLHRHTRLLEVARQRLTAMRQHNQLGAGFRIAMRDLELRGAGNLLGAEQSGHIVGVGFELYCQLLRQSVARLKGEKSAAAIRASVTLDFVFVGEGAAPASDAAGRHVDGYTALKDAEKAHAVEVARIQARIPPAYLAETRLRIDAYRKLALADSLAALKQIEADLRDRFGKFGDEVRALLLITEIRIRAEQKGIVSVETESSRLKCLRNSGRRDDWVQVGTRFPRLTAPKPLLRLKEIIAFLNNLPNP
ncbi:MAG: transcription-repair coupling factor [Hyphomicrobiaceae bacterium]|nr:transcription-repair coupling factor [Hyphomicrobiaceae bacterium]